MKDNSWDENMTSNIRCYYNLYTLSASCVTLSFIPLHRLADRFMLRNNMIGVPIFKEKAYEGTSLNSS
jgi:hypothetical protein